MYTGFRTSTVFAFSPGTGLVPSAKVQLVPFSVVESCWLRLRRAINNTSKSKHTTTANTETVTTIVGEMLETEARSDVAVLVPVVVSVVVAVVVESVVPVVVESVVPVVVESVVPVVVESVVPVVVESVVPVVVVEVVESVVPVVVESMVPVVMESVVPVVVAVVVVVVVEVLVQVGNFVLISPYERTPPQYAGYP